MSTSLPLILIAASTSGATHRFAGVRISLGDVVSIGRQLPGEKDATGGLAQALRARLFSGTTNVDGSGVHPRAHRRAELAEQLGLIQDALLDLRILVAAIPRCVSRGPDL